MLVEEEKEKRKERNRLPFKVGVCFQDNVDTRVIRVLVDSVRSIRVEAGGKPPIHYLQASNNRHVPSLDACFEIFKMSGALLKLLWVCVVSSNGVPPAVYWLSSPTYANETLLIAGAGFAGSIVQICTHGEACLSAGTRSGVWLDAPDARVWEQSVQVVLPSPLPAPSFISIDSGSEIVQINRPDVWWVTTGRPSTLPSGTFQLDKNHPSWMNATVTRGDTVRVFGRSLSTSLFSFFSPSPLL